MFAGRRFESGEELCTLSGRVVFGAITEDGPNYIGLGPDVWIDPVSPLDQVNHRCTPNAAFSARRKLRALGVIHPGEEITIDYSTTEADADWWMRCECGAPDCRAVLFAIQRSFADQAVAPPASPLMQLVWQHRHEYYRDEVRGRAFPPSEAPRITPPRWLTPPPPRRQPATASDIRTRKSPRSRSRG